MAIGSASVVSITADTYRLTAMESSEGAEVTLPDSRPVVLIVTPDDFDLYALRTVLQQEGFRTHATLARDAVASLGAVGPQLVLVSQLVDARGGLDVCARIRRRSTVPIVVLASWDSGDDIEAGLHEGADHYVVWPQRRREMVARLRAVLRQSSGYRLDTFRWQPFQVDDLHLDPSGCLATIGDRRVQLSDVEFAVLAVLALHDGHLVSRSQLATKVWGEGCVDTARRLKSTVRRLRVKLDHLAHGSRIVAVRGLGYRYASSPAKHKYILIDSIQVES
jgi:DNA-binding response OmpR family regulator